MIYMMWRFNFRDSLFPSQPIPAHVEVTNVDVYPPTGNVGETISITSTYTNLGEQTRTVKTYYQVIAHNQSLVAATNFTNEIQGGGSFQTTHNWTITENAKKYQDITGGEYIKICTTLNG